MLARNSSTALATVKRVHHLQMLVDNIETLVEIWQGSSQQLGKQPWLTHGSAANHHTLGTACAQRLPRRRGIDNIAVDQQRHT